MTNPSKRAGRIIGVLFLVQMSLAPLSNFVLLGPAIIAPPGFLTNAAGHATQVNVAVILSLLTGATWLGIAITAFPVFGRHSRSLATWLLALAVVSLCGSITEGVAAKSLLALSQAHVKADAASAALFHAPATLARSVRNSVHYMNLLLSGVSLAVLYTVLFRSTLIPRPLSVFGLATVALLIAGALIPLLGYRTVMLMFMPMGISQLALTAWLIARGFPGTPHSARATTGGSGR